MSNGKLESPKKGFQFFREHARTAEPFTIDDLINSTGWSQGSIATYRSKQWKDLLEDEPDGRLRVRREFLRLSEREFLDHISQKRPLFTQYKRTAYPAVLTFEFLIPLTRESQLRAALDELFYADTIRQRLMEIGLESISTLLPRMADETDDAFLDRAIQFSNKFYGYSVSHVSGRFRASSDLMSRAAAATHITDGGRYLIDETTAVVRFVLPLQTSSHSFSDSLFIPTDLDDADLLDEAMRAQEIRTLRTMFFLLFVEAVVRTIKGEDEIWLLEHGERDRLYVWSRVAK